MINLFGAFLLLLSGSTCAELDLEQFCLDKSLNEVVAHPQDCGGYIMCSEQPTAEYCAEGFHFDIRGLVCNWPEKVNCQLSSRQVEKVTDISSPALTSFAAFDVLTGQVVSPMVDYNPLNVVCRHFGAYFLPNPQKCRNYYLCAYGHMHEHACGPHTLWDYKLQQCVLAHHAVCYQFHQEEENELNLILYNTMMVCYPVNANVSSSGATVKTITVTPPPTPPTFTAIPANTQGPLFSNHYNITCPVKRQSYVAHPEDCSKYFMCIMGRAVMTSCPKGLLWDSKKANCDIGKNVKCEQRVVKEKEQQ